MYGAMLSLKEASAEDFATLRLAISGGEPLSRAVAREWTARYGITPCEGYGLTETSPVTNVGMPWHSRPGSVGPPLPGVIERIVDIRTGATLGPNREGEVQIKGPNVMRGYFKLPEETAAAFTGDGYLRTGDIGTIDEDGHLSITGRLKEMMIIGGENVFPREIEEALQAHPGVAMAGVIGVRDPMRGELPIAFVEMKEGAAFDERALLAWCRERLAGYKVPAAIRRLDALPKGPTGKVQRRDLSGLV
jgi:long-chain acyl-CoA synthetase